MISCSELGAKKVVRVLLNEEKEQDQTIDTWDKLKKKYNFPLDFPMSTIQQISQKCKEKDPLPSSVIQKFSQLKNVAAMKSLDTSQAFKMTDPNTNKSCHLFHGHVMEIFQKVVNKTVIGDKTHIASFRFCVRKLTIIFVQGSSTLTWSCCLIS